MTDRGCCSPVRERIDDGGVEPRWRRPTGKEMGTLLCSLSLLLRLDLQKNGFGAGRRCRPREQDEAPRGSAATTKGGGLDLTGALLPC